MSSRAQAGRFTGAPPVTRASPAKQITSLRDARISQEELITAGLPGFRATKEDPTKHFLAHPEVPLQGGLPWPAPPGSKDHLCLPLFLHLSGQQQRHALDRQCLGSLHSSSVGWTSCDSHCKDEKIKAQSH